jgi:IS30 family transposase
MKQSTEHKFVLAKTLQENGVNVKQIADIVGRKPHTVQIWLHYKTYQEYCDVSAKRLAKYNKDKTSVKVKETIEYAFSKEVIDRLDRIEKLLSVKKVIW